MSKPGLAIVIVVGLLAALAGAWGVRQLVGWLNPVDRQLASYHQAPLIGLALVDHPEIEARLRQIMTDGAGNPAQDTRNRVLGVMADLRHNVIAPALRRADDASLEPVMAARVALVRHLQQANLPACHMNSRWAALPASTSSMPKAKRLFYAMLSATEGAYRNGRDNPATPPYPGQQQQVHAMLVEAGFTPADFAQLAKLAALPDDVTCQLELRVDQAPSQVKPDERGPLSRVIVSQ